MLVALRCCLHGGERLCCNERDAHPGLLQQSDQPLPLHGHQQRRQGRLGEFLLQIQKQSGGSGVAGNVLKFVIYEEDQENLLSTTRLLTCFHEI